MSTTPAVAEFSEIARAYRLGAVHDAMSADGGLSNDLWRVTTESGSFAVKVMRVNADTPFFESNIEAAFRVEKAAFERGVPCPAPVSLPDGRCMARVDESWVRVHRWVDGVPPDVGERSGDAAVLLAAIHSGAAATLAPLSDEPWDAAGWGGLADQPGMDPDLAQVLRDAAGALADLEAATSAAGLHVPHVLSHGDLDPKNTLVVEGTLWAVDWDTAGPQPQAREAVAVALDWTTSPHDFRVALNAYSETGGGIPTEPWVFGGWVSAIGGWLAYNATQRIDTDQGRRETAKALQRLTALHSHLPAYVAALA